MRPYLNTVTFTEMQCSVAPSGSVSRAAAAAARAIDGKSVQESDGVEVKDGPSL